MEEELIVNATPCEMITNDEGQVIVIKSQMGTCLRIEVRFPSAHILKSHRDYLYDMISKSFFNLSITEGYVLLDMQCGKKKCEYLSGLLRDYLAEV